MRFRGIELNYGCHAEGDLRLPETDGPVVITGPNGSGKTTLLEALVRTLFGFNRAKDVEKTILHARRPWRGAGCTGRVELADPEGRRWIVARDFDSSEVELVPLEHAGDAWKGDGNPGGSNAETREYRRRLEALIGFPERDTYVSTACIHQGALGETRLDQELLRLAAGGHGDVDGALDRITKGFRKLTRRPLEEGARRAVKQRELEDAEDQLESLREALATAEAAERRRGPLLKELEETTSSRADLEAEIELLESAHAPVAQRRALEAEAGSAQERVARLERLQRRLERAVDAHERAEEEWRATPNGARYPEDFPARLEAIALLWRQRDGEGDHGDQESPPNATVGVRGELREAREALEDVRPPGWRTPVLALAAVLVLGGAALGLTGQQLPGAVLLLAGLLAGALAAFESRRKVLSVREDRQRRVAELEKRLAELNDQIAARLEGLPDSDTLTPATAPDRLAEHRRQQRVAQALDDAQEALASASSEAEELLEPEESAAAGTRDAAGLLEAVQEALAAARRETARIDLELQEATGTTLELPEGVEPTAAGVTAALAGRRKELGRLSERTRELERRLSQEAGGTESPVALRDRVRAAESRVAELEVAASAYREAYSLLRDAYTEFRERDQERLTDRVSGHLMRLTDGELGPVEAREGLSNATVKVGDRPIRLGSPPLSFGEYHATLLAIRLGASDFLAAAGIRPPLLVDEPFAHLDPERAAGVWNLLRDIARERQVILATQDRLMLDHLGIRPDVEFRRDGSARGLGATDNGAGAASRT